MAGRDAGAHRRAVGRAAHRRVRAGLPPRGVHPVRRAAGRAGAAVRGVPGAADPAVDRGRGDVQGPLERGGRRLSVAEARAESAAADLERRAGAGRAGAHGPDVRRMDDVVQRDRRGTAGEDPRLPRPPAGSSFAGGGGHRLPRGVCRRDDPARAGRAGEAAARAVRRVRRLEAHVDGRGALCAAVGRHRGAVGDRFARGVHGTDRAVRGDGRGRAGAAGPAAGDAAGRRAAGDRGVRGGRRLNA